MINSYFSDLAVFIFELSFLILVFSTVLGVAIFYIGQVFKFFLNLKNFSLVFLVRYILAVSLLVSFILLFISFLLLSSKVQKLQYFSLYSDYEFAYFNFFFYKISIFTYSSVKCSLDLFGVIFLLLAYAVGLISFLALDSKLYSNNIKFMFICNVLVLSVFLFIIVNDLILFFLFYETMLIPSFLFVYYVSPYRRGVQASLYFLIWTQIGSLLVLSAISYIVYSVGSGSFDILNDFIFTSDEKWWLYFFLFFGFGFKVPIWPLQYWLTKTHVEAPAGFSIFLSGFLVKTAIYGFYKITNNLGLETDTSLFFVFAYVGVCDASWKMWSQSDLKKLVAYGTVQEMNLIYISFLWGDSNAIVGGVLFCITHAFLSALMFYIVDCVQRRYSTRNVNELSGVLHITPNLGIAILIMQVLYAGLPGTLKFVSELYIFTGLFNSMSFLSFFVLFVANFLGLIGFSKCWFNVLFGLNMKQQDAIPMDLTFKEFLIICLCVVPLFLFSFGLNVII